MKNTTKLISALLTVMLLLGAFTNLIVFEASAAGDKKSPDEILAENVNSYIKDTGTVFATPQEKVESMKLKLDKDGYQLYVDELTGEIATVDKASGQILFSNPWDITTTSSSDNVKKQIMSQIVIKYTDNDNSKYFYSFEEAAVRGQIKVKNIKNGIRVEYIIGREESKKLVPRSITMERFDTLIRPKIIEGYGDNTWGADKVLCYFLARNPEAETSAALKEQMYQQFPITKKFPIYILDSSTSNTELAWLEEQIKTYCPEYTYEQLEYDHELTQYEGTDTNPPLFKLAIEYNLDEYGLTWKVPVNGLRYDESRYKLSDLSIHPWLGCGTSYAGADKTKVQKGYAFYPDGSGTLFDNDMVGTVTSKIYGFDYAYQSVEANLREKIRYPVFGITEQQQFTKNVTETVLKTPEHIDEKTGETVPAVYETVIKKVDYTEDHGFVAIIEEGDALASLTFVSDTKSKYYSVQTLFNPRPSDSYNLADSISVGQNKTWTVVSKRKYVGNYKVRYLMLTDSKIAEERGITDYYPCSWLGMARAYSDYLVKQGQLERLKEDEITSNIPLYVETFGTFKTLEKVMSIPVNVMTPLTTFENVKTMYSELKEKGIDNINFKLTGYANGGVYSKVPYNLKWEKAVGGKSGFEDLLEYAKTINASGNDHLGIYPDFDFSYVRSTGWFDGVSLKKHAVKTIDDRYIIRKQYSSTYQLTVGYYGLALSPAYFSHFYEKLTKNYLKYDPIGISVATLGSDLNSDFDEDEPYNREDSKKFITELFAQIKKDYPSVMTDSGNSFTWKYVDHILNLPLDSSRFTKSANAVPFIGVVLHGYIQFAGTPYNMEGNTEYAKLKAIENGASLYFTLNYQNSQKFKEYWDLSQYYSISYDIWFDELCDIYNELNSVLKDVQTKIIINHEFLNGERIPDIDELEADILAIAKEAMKSEDDAIVAAAIKAQGDILKARRNVESIAVTTVDNKTMLATITDTVSASYATLSEAYNAIAAKEADVELKKQPIEPLKNAMDVANEAYKAATTALAEANVLKNTLSRTYSQKVQALKDFRTAATKTEEYKAAYEIEKAKDTAQKDAKTAYDNAQKGTDEALIASTKKAYEDALAAYNDAKAATEAIVKAFCYAETMPGSKAAYDEYEKALNEYNAQIAVTDEKTVIATEKSKVYNEAKAKYDEAVAALDAAKKAVDAAITDLAVALTKLVDSYTRVISRQLDSDALKGSATTGAALELIVNNPTVTEDVQKELKAYATTVFENVTEAVYSGLKAIPTITKGIKDTTASDIHRLDIADPALRAAFNDYKAATDALEAIQNKQGATSAEINAAKTALSTARVAFENALKEVQSIVTSMSGKHTNVLKIYNSTKTYGAYIAASECADAATKADAEGILATVKADTEAVVATAESIAAKAAELNALIKGFGYINVPKVEVTTDEPTTEPEPTPGETEDGETTPGETEDGETTTPGETEDGNQSDTKDFAEGETKYTSNDGQIVAVTYGGKDGNDNTPYKTFILNFNYFAVTVRYNGVLYTIPANGYVVIYR